MGAVKVGRYSFAKAMIWMGLTAVLVLTVVVFVVKGKPANTPPSINNISISPLIPSASSHPANTSDDAAAANNKKLNEGIALSDTERANRERIKVVSDIQIDDPLHALPSLKQILENKEETPAVKTLALSKLIEINTEESVSVVCEYVKNKDAEIPWIRNTAVALLVKADTPFANVALDKLKASGDSEIIEFLNKLQR